MAIAVQQQNQIEVAPDRDGLTFTNQRLGNDDMTQCNVVVTPVNVAGLIRARRAGKREARKAEE